MLWRCFYLFCPLDNSTHQSSPCPHKFFTINYCIATRSSWEKRHFYIQKKLVYHPYTNVLCWNSALFHTAQTDFNLNWLYGPLVPIEVYSIQGFTSYPFVTHSMWQRWGQQVKKPDFKQDPLTTVLFVLNKSWWTVGSEGTMLMGGSIRVQRHPSQGSVRRGKFYSLTVTSHRVKFAPTYRDLGGVSLHAREIRMTTKVSCDRFRSSEIVM